MLFVRGALDLAVADHLLADSPAAGLKIKQAKKPVRKTPSFEEFVAIVAAIRAQVYNAEATDSGDFVEFVGLAGLGQAEAGALCWADIDWDKDADHDVSPEDEPWLRHPPLSPASPSAR